MDYETMRRWANSRSPFMLHSGILITDVGQDCATASADLSLANQNPYGAAHGGFLFTMADCATGMAVHSDGRHYVTLNSTLNFMRMAKEGTVTADARVIKRGHTVTVSEVIIRCNGQDLATGTFTYYCLDTQSEKSPGHPV